MIIKKGFKYRFRPNKKIANLCWQFAGASRWIFNYGLEQRKTNWEEKKIKTSLFQQNNELPKLKQQKKTSWLKDIHSQILQQSLNDLDMAFQHFFRRLKLKDNPGYPRFKCKGERDSFRYPQGVKVKDNKVFLPKIGWICFKKSREIQGEIKQTTITNECGKWYVCFSCEIEIEDQPLSTDPSVRGIDVGLENFAIIATQNDIKEVPNPRLMKRELNHLKYMSRQLSKKKKRSGRRKLAKAKLQTFHKKIRDRRKDFLHKLSTQLVKIHDKIVVESLKVKSMLQKAPRALARSISDVGWRKFLQQLKYKCEYSFKSFEEAGDFFPSSKRCSQCGKIQKMKLLDRRYKCYCGLDIHRDHNSAINLRAVGTTGIKACGAALIRGSNETGILRL